jgi:hypothetical protein
MDVCAGVSVQISDKVTRIISKCGILSILRQCFDNKSDNIVVFAKKKIGFYAITQIRMLTLLSNCQSCHKSGAEFR